MSDLVGRYPNMLAGGVTLEGTFAPFELWAGESDIVTSQGTADVTAIEQFRVLARSTTGTLIPWDGATLSGQGRAIGFAAQPIPANTSGPIFVGGFVNHLALIWPASVTALWQRKQAFDGTNIEVGAILGISGPIVYNPAFDATGGSASVPGTAVHSTTVALTFALSGGDAAFAVFNNGIANVGTPVGISAGSSPASLTAPAAPGTYTVKLSFDAAGNDVFATSNEISIT